MVVLGCSQENICGALLEQPEWSGFKTENVSVGTLLYCKVSPALLQRPLCSTAKSQVTGYKAIIARTWRTNFVRGDDFGPPYPLIVGMDVLIRPDLLAILEQQFGSNRVSFCSKHTESADDEHN